MAKGAHIRRLQHQIIVNTTSSTSNVNSTISRCLLRCCNIFLKHNKHDGSASAYECKTRSSRWNEWGYLSLPHFSFGWYAKHGWSFDAFRYAARNRSGVPSRSQLSHTSHRPNKLINKSSTFAPVTTCHRHIATIHTNKICHIHQIVWFGGWYCCGLRCLHVCHALIFHELSSVKCLRIG